MPEVLREGLARVTDSPTRADHPEASTLPPGGEVQDDTCWAGKNSLEQSYAVLCLVTSGEGLGSEGQVGIASTWSIPHLSLWAAGRETSWQGGRQQPPRSPPATAIPQGSTVGCKAGRRALQRRWSAQGVCAVLGVTGGVESLKLPFAW